LIAIGNEAKKYCRRKFNFNCDDIEAVAVDIDLETFIYFEYLDRTDIFSSEERNINSDIYFNEFKKSASFLDIEFRQFEEIDSYLVEWHRVPVLDHGARSLYWAYELTNGFENIVSASVLKPGNKGAVQITWITNPLFYLSFGNKLDAIAKAHSFQPENLYRGDFNELLNPGVALLLSIDNVIRGSGFVFFFYMITRYFGRKRQTPYNEPIHDFSD
jgi:hypothetical protein